jgi:hypothetical protein
MLFALCLPVLVHGNPVKFISSGDYAYAEVTVDGRVHKIYTESRGDYRALFVLGEKNNPEMLKFSYADSSRKINTTVLELRSEKDVPSPGLEVATNEFIASLRSDADGFADWQARFSSFPEKPTDSAVVPDASFADPIGIEIFDEKGGLAERRIKNWLCGCQHGLCFATNALCLMRALCGSWDCISTGNWGPECEAAHQEARQCMILQQ